jgi:hypothetical protein
MSNPYPVAGSAGKPSPVPEDTWAAADDAAAATVKPTAITTAPTMARRRASDAPPDTRSRHAAMCATAQTRQTPASGHSK